MKEITVRNPLRLLRQAGQSVWLDYIHRHLLRSGELARLVEEDGVSGVTSNPTIFEKAISASDDYADALARLRAGRASVVAAYETLVAEDITAACDILRPTFDQTGGADGFVSVEVSPLLARDTAGTIQEVRQWIQRIGRPNLMVKIPGTPEGEPAIEEMIAEGHNINITLLFSVPAYARVAEAYLHGLERRVAAGQPIDRVASVASFFVSRIDTETDTRLAARLASAGGAERALLAGLQGKVAIANAKLAYRVFREAFTGDRYKHLAARGARVQRPLWGSTSTKNPAYPDLLYVEALVGPDTVDTLPPQTISAFRDHGRVNPDAVTEGLAEATAVFAQLQKVGISIDEVTQRVLEAGIASFADSYRQLLAAIEQRLRSSS
ncbi:MAG TPA: transaldolase [bacterium]|nr:transaldolase [bacterium]